MRELEHVLHFVAAGDNVLIHGRKSNVRRCASWYMYLTTGVSLPPGLSDQTP